MRVKHRREGKCKIVLHFSMRVVPRIMMIRPGTGNCPGVLFMYTGAKGYLLLSQYAPGAASRGKNLPLLDCTLEKNNPSRNFIKRREQTK